MARRYVFQPLERRGVLLGLQAGQVATLGGGLVLALLTGRAAGGVGGTALAVGVLAGSAAAALWPRAGRVLIQWAPIFLAWVGRGAGRPVLERALWSGTMTPAATVNVRRQQVRPGPRPRLAPGVRVVDSGEGFGLVHDQRHGACAAVMPVGGRPFSLLDPDEQEQRLEAWRAVLGALARPGSPLRRVQWVQRTWSEDEPAAPAQVVLAEGSIPAARSSYQDLIESLPPATNRQVWLALAVSGRPGRSTVDVLGRELRLLHGSLRSADLGPSPALDATAVSALIAGQAGRAGGAGGPAWPLATEETWAAWHADGLWHATYWISEWPRVEVPADFLGPMLLSGGQRTISVVMAPVPVDRALREARSARTADLADAEIRHRAGFVSSARREMESMGAVQREHELAEGHCEFRFSGYITVTAGGRPELDVACAEMEHSAQSAHLELRRLYGRQAEAFTWTLPLGRGLAGR